MFFGISFLPTRHKGETRIPWERWKLLSPLQGHIGAKLYLEGLDTSICGKNPWELSILLSPQGGLRRIKNIPGNYCAKNKV